MHIFTIKFYFPKICLCLGVMEKVKLKGNRDHKTFKYSEQLH